jgi:hypothetical protein
MPFTTGIGINAVKRVRSPVILNKNIQLATKIPAAAVCPAVNDFEIATAAIAFIG